MSVSRITECQAGHDVRPWYQLRSGWRSLNFGFSTCPPMLLGLIVLAVGLSRLFFLGGSYGSNPDAWRAFSASQHLVATGIYVPSRFPGYPLPEYFGALLLKLGWGSPWAFELPVAMLSSIAVGLLFWLLLPLGYLAAVGSSLALAFTPVFFIASTESMDYIYGFTFFMAATLAAFRGKVLCSGVFLGLAAASRPTYALSYIPLALVLAEFHFDRETLYGSLKKLTLLAAVSGAIALSFYSQLFSEYGLTFLRAYDDGRPLLPMLRALPMELFGQIGRFGVGVAVAASMIAVVRKRDVIRQHRCLLLFVVTVAVIYLLLFWRLPHEPSYLIPVLPAIYVWLAVAIPPRSSVALAALLLASCFLHLNAETGRLSLEWRGPIPVDQRQQQAYPCIAREVATAAYKLDADTYIQSGYLTPYLRVLLPESLSGRIVYAMDAVSSAGYVVHEDTRVLPPGTRFLTIDRVNSYVRNVFADNVPVSGLVDTTMRCAY